MRRTRKETSRAVDPQMTRRKSKCWTRSLIWSRVMRKSRSVEQGARFSRELQGESRSVGQEA
eukprot:2962514-Rhodomonas_salina.1